jgi:hypothetical protein
MNTDAKRKIEIDFDRTLLTSEFPPAKPVAFGVFPKLCVAEIFLLSLVLVLTKKTVFSDYEEEIMNTKPTSKILIQKFMRAIFLAGALIVAAGCASYDIAKPVKSFSDATVATAGTTRQAFETTDETFIRRTVEETIAAYPANHSVLTNLTFKNLNPYLPPEHLQARLDVLAALQTYAEKLAALAGNEQTDQFDKQAQALGEKLKGINKDVVKTKLLSTSANENEINILTTAIREMGMWLINRERRKAIKNSVTEMQPHVEAIASYLHDDFQDLARQADNDYHQIVNSLVQPIKDGTISDPAARDQRLRQIATTILEGKKAIAAANSLSSAAIHLAQAHKLLADAVTKPNTKFGDLVNEVSEEAKSAKNFYDSLNKKN